MELCAWVKEWKSGQVKLCVRCGLTKKYSNGIEYKMKKPSWNFLKVPYCTNFHARKQLIWVTSLYPDGKLSYKFRGGSMILRTILNFIIFVFLSQTNWPTLTITNDWFTLLKYPHSLEEEISHCLTITITPLIHKSGMYI